jgi:hypothetical protein
MFTERDSEQIELVELSPEEDRQIVEREARRQFNMGADEFAQRWHAGEYRSCDDPKVTSLGMLLPDAR